LVCITKNAAQCHFLCLDILSLDEDESISTSTTEDFIIKDQNSEITCGFDCLKQGNKGRHDPGAAAASLPVAAAASQDFFLILTFFK